MTVRGRRLRGKKEDWRKKRRKKKWRIERKLEKK